MSSGFSGGGGPPDFFNAGRRSTTMNPQNQYPYRSPLSGIPADPVTQIAALRRPDLAGKRSLAEFQQQQQIQSHHGLGFYLRNVKQRPNYQHASPISPLSPVVFSPEVSNSSAMNARYGLPILHQLKQQPLNLATTRGIPSPNLVQNRASMNTGTKSSDTTITNTSTSMGEMYMAQESEKKKLQELEKELLGDEDEDEGEAVSVVTNSEWSGKIQNLISPTHMPISPSPTSSSSSCSSTSASPPIPCPKQSLIDAAAAISDGKPELAAEMLTRIQQVANVKGTCEQRLAFHVSSALKMRVESVANPSQCSELFSKEHSVTTQMLYHVSPCFKFSFMAANLAILEACSEHASNKLHVVDFDIGQGDQYRHLLHALAPRKNGAAVLKITTFTDFTTGSEEKVKIVGEGLKALASRIGVALSFSVLNLKLTDLSREKLGVEPEEVLAVNFAFKLYKLPDESVTTENLRDEMLRRVKGLSPAVVTVVEQEMNANTAPLVARVREVYEYYGALFDSLDSTVSRDNPDRVRIEEGLCRKLVNSVACEGRDRVERCEVFGKWRARMGMAGFKARTMSQLVADSLRSKLNPGFTVNEQSGGIFFGWMGRTLAVTSAWF